ncbi:MAG: IS66 family transposase [Janthinobacterium lividum]
MRIPLDSLPMDITMLQQLVHDTAALVRQDATVTGGQIEIDRLRLIIKQFQQTQFGRSADRLKPDQMAFGLEELEADLAWAEARRAAAVLPASAEAVLTAPAKPLHQAQLPAHLPRTETVIPAPHESCLDCGGVLHDVGTTSSEMLDWIPAQIRVIRITRPKQACRCCGTLHQAPAPERVLAGSLATPGLIAHVLVSRYCDHLPLYRQNKIFVRHGLEISRSTLSGWIGTACWWLEAIYARLVAHVMAGHRVFADDTPLSVFDPGRGRTRTGRLWAYTRDDRSYGGGAPPATVFHYTPERIGARPTEHLKGFHGILQVDSYAGFEALPDNGAVTLAACWAHAWRKFFELHEAGSPVATEAVRQIGKLYEIEATIRGWLPNERLRVRQQKSLPLVEFLQAWLHLQLLHLPDHNRLTEAMRYALGRWTALTRFLDDGRVDLDTNPVEQAIRPTALGRKNSLFAGSDGGANRWTIVTSLVETAKLNNVEPFAWLHESLTMMVNGHPANRLNELLPFRQRDE